MKYRTSLFIALAATSATALASKQAGGASDGVMFKRVFAKGSLAEFSFKEESNIMGPGGMQAILRERVLKPNEDGSPRVSYETVSLVATGNATVPSSPPPMTTNVTGNALGSDFGFTIGQVDFLYFMLASAATSPEKQVKVGDEFPIKWASTKQSFSVDGKGMITNISAKEVREELTLQMTMDGKPVGTLHWSSAISTINYSLLWSQGTWSIQDTVTTSMTISRKAPSGS